MSTSLFKRILDVLREEGFAGFRARALAACGYERLCLLERSLCHEPLPEARAKIPVVIDWLKPEEEPDHVALLSTAHDWPLMRTLSPHERCLTARVEGRLVAVMWACTGTPRVEFLDLHLPLAADEAYLCAAYTHPDFRGHGIAPALSVELMRRLRETGCARAIRGTLPESTPAMRAHAKAGFQPFALISRLRLGPWSRTFRRDLASSPRHPDG